MQSLSFVRVHGQEADISAARHEVLGHVLEDEWALGFREVNCHLLRRRGAHARKFGTTCGVESVDIYESLTAKKQLARPRQIAGAWHLYARAVQPLC